AHEQETAVGHRVAGVQDEVHHELLELRAADVHRRNLRVGVDLEPDVLVEQPPEQRLEPADDLVQRDALLLDVAAAGEREQLAGQLAAFSVAARISSSASRLTA